MYEKPITDLFVPARELHISDRLWPDMNYVARRRGISLRDLICVSVLHEIARETSRSVREGFGDEYV